MKFTAHQLEAYQRDGVVPIGKVMKDDIGANSGHVQVYQYDSGNWTRLGSDIDGEAAGDQLGQSVSLSSDGSIVAIGAYMNDDIGADSGHVRVYE